MKQITSDRDVVIKPQAYMKHLLFFVATIGDLTVANETPDPLKLRG